MTKRPTRFPSMLAYDGREIQTMMGLVVARCETEAGAAEIVRRYNRHADLVLACEAMLEAYAPFAQREADRQGEGCLHPAVRLARTVVAQAKPWVVTAPTKGTEPGERLPILGRFASEAEASAFIATLPNYLSGCYGLDGPTD